MISYVEGVNNVQSERSFKIVITRPWIQIRAPDYGEENVVNVDDIRKKLQNFNPADDPDCPDVRFPCSCLDPISLTNKS